MVICACLIAGINWSNLPPCIPNCKKPAGNYDYDRSTCNWNNVAGMLIHQRSIATCTSASGVAKTAALPIRCFCSSEMTANVPLTCPRWRSGWVLRCPVRQWVQPAGWPEPGLQCQDTFLPGHVPGRRHLLWPPYVRPELPPAPRRLLLYVLHHWNDQGWMSRSLCCDSRTGVYPCILMGTYIHRQPVVMQLAKHTSRRLVPDSVP